MKDIKRMVFSTTAPNVRVGTVWAKPVDGGFNFFLLEDGEWKPLRTTGVETTDITALTGEQLDSLRVGDKVTKITGKAKHLYTVTYKGDGVGEGICMTYAAAGLVETVSYDFTSGGWVFNSIDKSTLTVDD